VEGVGALGHEHGLPTADVAEADAAWIGACACARHGIEVAANTTDFTARR